VKVESGSNRATLRESSEGPQSAHLPRCRIFRRRPPHWTQNGRSALVAGTGLHGPHRRPWPQPARRRRGTTGWFTGVAGRL